MWLLHVQVNPLLQRMSLQDQMYDAPIVHIPNTVAWKEMVFLVPVEVVHPVSYIGTLKLL